MKTYELLTIIKPSADADEADKITVKIEENIKNFGGKVLETEKVGRKKLAYDIQNFRDGFMIVQQLQIPADKITEFKRQLRLNENILRTMFVEVAKTAAKV